MNIETEVDDLISFLDSQMWIEFKQIIPETGKKVASNLINILNKNISEGKMTIEGIFQNFNFVDLVNSFSSLPNLNFFNMCINICKDIQIVQLFVEKIIVSLPDFVIGCLSNENFSVNYEFFEKIAQLSVFLFNYNYSKTVKIQEILMKIPIEIAAKEIFDFLNNYQSSSNEIVENSRLNKHSFIDLIQKVSSKNEILFWNFVKKNVKKENKISFELLTKAMSGIKEFHLLFELDENCEEKNKNEIVFSISELISYFEQTNEIHEKLIDLYNSDDKKLFNYLIKSIEQSIEIPESTKTEFLNKLRSMNMVSNTIDIEKLNLNLNDHIVTIDQVIEYIERSIIGCENFANKLFNIFHLSFMEQNEQTVKSFCDQFYLKYINKLQFQTLDKLAEVAVQFLTKDLIQQHRASLSALAIRLPISRYINKLFFNELNSTQTQSDYGKNIQKNVIKEISILENLHIAAIQTCNYLKLNSQGGSSFSSSQKIRSKKNINQNSLNIISSNSQISRTNSNPNSIENSYCDKCKLSLVKENLNKTVVGIDRKLILRLRWRTLRDDASSICTFLPEFIQLCESDEKLFLKWEASCSYPTGIKRNQILMKLGISNNGEIISPLIYELLKIEASVDDNLIEILNQIFSNNIDLKTLKIPENPNLSILFRFNFLWCTAVMYHPQICKVLRNPSKEISLSLFRSLLSLSITRDFLNNEIRISDFTEEDDRSTKMFDQLFTTFPLGFSAIISQSTNYGSLKDSIKTKNFLQDLNFISKLKKPPQINSAEQILNGFKKPSKNMPRYLIVSVAFEFAKRKELLRLADLANGDQNWVFFCFFFSITFQYFDVSVNLLKKFDFLFDFIHKGVGEENLFVGHGKWKSGLIKFFNYCSSNDIAFNEHRSWILLANEISQNSLSSSNAVPLKKDEEIRSDDADWITKDPIEQSNSSSPLSSQNFSNPQ